MKDSSRLDLLAAILGTLGVLLLLVAAFAAAAQEPQTTERMIVGVADWAEGDRAQSCTRSTSGAGIVDVAAAMIAAAAPAPATAPAMTASPVSMTTVAPASAAVSRRRRWRRVHARAEWRARCAPAAPCAMGCHRDPYPSHP